MPRICTFIEITPSPATVEPTLQLVDFKQK